MTEQLRYAFELAQKLSEADQDALAAYILAEIEKQGWGKIARQTETHPPQPAPQDQANDELDEPEAPEFDCL